MPDETEGDDGAVFHFWEWFARKRGRPIDLANVDAFLHALEDFEHEEPHP